MLIYQRVINPKRLFDRGVSFKYQIVIIGGVPPLNNRPWFIHPWLTFILNTPSIIINGPKGMWKLPTSTMVSYVGGV